jgi:uncharacterized protein (DUF58 family)
MRVTRTGWLLLGIAVALYLASLTSQSAFLLLPVGIIGGCIALNILGARRSVKHLKLVPPGSTSLAEGQSLREPWQVRNESKREIGQLSVESHGTALLKVAALPGKAQQNLVPARQFARRGVYRFEQLHVSSTFPFGLVSARKGFSAPGEVVVYPAIYPATSPRAAGFDSVVGGKFHGQKRSAAGTHFAGLRPFHAGDPLKQIHWKSSSKGRGLMVKTFEEELSGRVAIITDAVGGMDGPVLDDALRAAGSLMFAALDSGHHVEWVDLATLEPVLFPPFTDGQEILDLLARVEVLASDLTAERLSESVTKVSRKSALSFVLTQWKPEWETPFARLVAQGRNVSLYLPDALLVKPTSGISVIYYTAQEVLA